MSPDFCSVCTEFNSGEISGREQSLARNGHPSFAVQYPLMQTVEGQLALEFRVPNLEAFSGRFNPFKSTVPYLGPPFPFFFLGAGIAQWLEHRTRDWKVAGSNPCWNGGRIFFSRVDFLCWLLFRYPFHPRVTTVARKKSRSFCQKVQVAGYS